MAPVAILRSASNHLMRLQLAVAMLAGVISMDMALRTLSVHPCNFSRSMNFQQTNANMEFSPFSRALELLLQGEATCKTTGAPDHSLCSKTLMQVAALAREQP